jgi:NAD(P)-dependent dehydrogenase (short-subunit alcohol dehydrogenase family)
MPHWLITGCSSGLGRALALAVLDHGWDVTVTARRLEDLDTFDGRSCPLTLDVTDPGDIETVVLRSQERFGLVDVLVNNAGFGLRAAVEEADDSEIRALFEANFFGLVG